MNEKLKKILEQRTKTYGDYEGGCRFIVAIMHVISSRYSVTHKGKFMNPLHLHFIKDIVNKLSRLAVSPTHVDSWRDIAGYASLIADTLEREEQNADKQQSS